MTTRVAKVDQQPHWHVGSSEIGQQLRRKHGWHRSNDRFDLKDHLIFHHDIDTKITHWLPFNNHSKHPFFFNVQRQRTKALAQGDPIHSFGKARSECVVHIVTAPDDLSCHFVLFHFGSICVITSTICVIIFSNLRHHTQKTTGQQTIRLPRAAARGRPAYPAGSCLSWMRRHRIVAPGYWFANGFCRKNCKKIGAPMMIPTHGMMKKISGTSSLSGAFSAIRSARVNRWNRTSTA